MRIDTMTGFELLLFIVLALFIAAISFLTGRTMGKFLAQRSFEKSIPSIREESVKKSRAVLSGQFSEQLAPYLPGFPFSPTEARFIGKPIDFLIFEGMDQKDISKVIFVEVKSGKSTLSNQERRLRETIKQKNVEWYEYRTP